MRCIAFAAMFLALILPATAQQANFAPISDRDLWDAMVKAIGDVPMSLTAHQQVQRILAEAQREALIRDSKRASAAAPKD